MSVTMFGAPPSLFSGKARAYLDWKGVEFSEKLPSDPDFISKVIPEVGRPVIPVIQLDDGTLLQDTTVIIDHFERQANGPSIYPETPRQRLAALLLECFGDEWLVIPAMHYRWHYNEEWIYSEFGKTALPGGTPQDQYEAGKQRGAMFKGFVPMLGINEHTAPAIEASYEALLGELDSHFGSHDFLFGSRPSIGDYGLIGPLYAHNYRDPKSGELMKRLAPNVARWVERMIEPEPLSGEFLADDEIPATLVPILARMMREHLPYLKSVAELLDGWAAQNPDAEVPRTVGMADFTIEGVTGQRAALPFGLWMFQRSLDYLASLNGDAREDTKALLCKCGGDAVVEFKMPCRLNFESFKLTHSPLG
ncbi:MAG: glutathione S-transferase family protein [Erythrobacter sp.]|uniref:glutathione S-transferase family protein n=1 Tax=Erythrobacter sp. TaxID=1042 RepID=UPI0032990C5E